MTNKHTAFRYVGDNEKECSRCEQIKPLSEFHKDKKHGYHDRHKGHTFYCKKCANEKARDWHEKNKNKVEVKRNKRNQWIKNAHGITLQEYEAKLKEQGSKCAICNIYLKPEGYGTHLDHCHKTKQLRDFLCTNCNRGLGHFQDNIDYLQQAIKYVEKHTND